MFWIQFKKEIIVNAKFEKTVIAISAGLRCRKIYQLLIDRNKKKASEIKDEMSLKCKRNAKVATRNQVVN